MFSVWILERCRRYGYLVVALRKLYFHLWLLGPILMLPLILVLSACTLSINQEAANPVLFLGWDDSATTQLIRYDQGKELQQLTSFTSDVFDYAPSPDGQQIIVAQISGDGDTILWIMRADGTQQKELHSCYQAECGKFEWASDSRRLLFEQRDLGDSGMAGSPTLWWLDTQPSEVLPVHEDENMRGSFGRLSPDGQWISYHSPEKEGLMIYNLQDGKSQFIINEIGTAAEWSPDSSYLVLPMLELVILHGAEGDDHETHSHDYQTAVHLQRLDPSNDERLNLSGDRPVEDSAPAWSPDGQWIAFGRRIPGTNSARQLWVMRADGSESRALTDDPSINHGPPSWSADGRYLLFQQIAHDDPHAEPQIWRINVDSGKKEMVAASGMQPVSLASER